MGLEFLEATMKARDVAPLLSRQYGVEANDVVPLSQRDPDAITYCSNSFVATTSDDDYIVKELTLDGTSKDLVYQETKADIADFLEARGVPIAHHHRTSEGKSFGDFKGHAVEVLDYIPNTRNYQFGNIGDVSEAAQALAGFNYALASLPTERPEIFQKLQARQDLFGTTGEDLDAILERKDFVDELTSVANKFRGIREDVLYFFEDVRRVREDWSGGLVGGTAVIHRDFHGNNVIFDKEDGELKAILDFDTICVGPSGYDLGYSGIFFSSDIPKPFEAPRIELFNLFGENYIQEMKSLEPSFEIESPVRAVEQIRRDMVNRTASVIMSRYFRGENAGDGPIVNHLGIHKRMRDLKKLIHKSLKKEYS